MQILWGCSMPRPVKLSTPAADRPSVALCALMRPPGKAPGISQEQLHRRHLLMQLCGPLLLPGVLWPATSAADVDHASMMELPEALSVPDIYAQYSYSSPKDVLPFVLDQAPAGDPEAVLRAIDDFSRAFPMYKIGPEKGAIVDALVTSLQPQLVVELGSFVGYSAVRIARLLPPGGRMVCVEANPECVAAMEGVLRHAGLRDKVVIEQGLSGDVVPRLVERYGPAQLLFEDHCKACYLPDLMVAEATGLMAPGSWTLADNVLVPSPLTDLMQHLRDTEAYRALMVRATYEYEQAWNPEWVSEKEDAMSIAVRTAGLTPSQLGEKEEQLEALCRKLGSRCSHM